MVIQGKEIAEEISAGIRRQLSSLITKPILLVINCSRSGITERYLKTKESFAKKVGIGFQLRTFRPDVVTAGTIRELIESANQNQLINGIVVQLPLPPSLEETEILSFISPEKDPDALGDNPLVRSPVVRSVAEIFRRFKVLVGGRSVVILGQGRLVGVPLALWFRESGVEPVIMDRASFSGEKLKSFDIVISGAGKPWMVSSKMIKEGAVVIDVGTSEAGGSVRGDVHPDVAARASLFSSVPGGVGPIAIAMLFDNLVQLTKQTGAIDIN